VNPGHGLGRARGRLVSRSVAARRDVVHEGRWFEAESPRWRLAEPARQAITEHERRFRGTPAPFQRGAIDGAPTLRRS